MHHRELGETRGEVDVDTDEQVNTYPTASLERGDLQCLERWDQSVHHVLETKAWSVRKCRHGKRERIGTCHGLIYQVSILEWGSLS